MALNLEAIRKKLEQIEKTKNNSSIQMWKADVGIYKIRVIPWKYAPEGLPFIERSMYYLGKGTRPILAPAQFGKPDPINEASRQLFSTKDPQDRALAKSLLPSTRVFAAIIVRGEEEKGPQLWSFKKKLEEEMLGFCVDSDYGDITGIEDGYDIKVKIEKSLKKFDGKSYNELSISCSPKPSPLSTDQEQIKKWIDSAPNVDDLYELMSYDEIKKALEDYLTKGHDGVIANEQEASSSEKNEALDSLEKEIQKTVESSTKATADVEEKKRKSSKKAEAALDKGFDDLDKELADLSS